VNQKTLHTVIVFYIAVAFLFMLYERPWDTKAWTDTDGTVQTATAWKYVIFWPYAVFLQATSGK